MAYTAADLEMVQHHVAQGELHIVRQEELISRLRSHGLPTAAAEDLLEEFRATLRQHRDHLAIIAKSMGQPT
jgi:hypothetical protein